MKTLDNLTYKNKPAADLYQRRVYLLSVYTIRFRAFCIRTMSSIASAVKKEVETNHGISDRWSTLPLQFSTQR